jgi:hypothetical protein
MKKVLLVSVLLATANLLFSQSVVEYTVGGQNPDYATLSDAAEGYYDESFSFDFSYDTVIYNIRGGVYDEQIVFTGDLNVNVTVIFQPESDNDEVIIEYDSDGVYANFLLEEMFNVVFRRITFRNTSEEQSAGILKVSEDNEVDPPNLELYNCRFESDLENIFLEKPLLVRSPNYHSLRVRNCYFEGGNVAIDVNRVERPFNLDEAMIYNNQFDSVYTAALKAEECLSLRFENNTINWSYTDGVKCSNSQSINATNNTIHARNALNCVFMEDSVVVRGNEISGFGNGFGLQSNAGQTGIEPIIKVENNSFTDCGDAVNISNFDEVTVFDNRIVNNDGEGASGISVEECQNGFTFINANEIIGSSGSNGVELNVISGLNSPIGGNHRVTNNMISGFKRAILLDTAEDVDLLYNSISSFGSAENAIALLSTLDIRLINNAIKHYGAGDETMGEVIFAEGNLNFEADFNVYDFDPEVTALSSEYETLGDAQLFDLDENSQVASIGYFNDQSDLKTCGANLFQEATALIEVSQDIFGFDRSGGQPTIGAQEIFSSSAEPVADFELTINEFTISTQNNTLQGGDYLWEFGDGNTSEAFEPVHTYAQMNGYSVTLNVESPCGTDNHTVLITIPGISEEASEFDFTVYPNPTSRFVSIQSDWTFRDSQLKVFDMSGRQVFDDDLRQNQKLDLRGLESGTYILLIEKEGTPVGSRQLIVQ